MRRNKTTWYEVLREERPRERYIVLLNYLIDTVEDDEENRSTRQMWITERQRALCMPRP